MKDIKENIKFRPKILILIGLILIVLIWSLPTSKAETTFDNFPELTVGDYFKHKFDEKMSIDNLGNESDKDNYIGYENENIDLAIIKIIGEEKVKIDDKTYDCIIMNHSFKYHVTLLFKANSTKWDDDKVSISWEGFANFWRIKSNLTIVKEEQYHYDCAFAKIESKEHITESYYLNKITYNKIDDYYSFPLKVGNSWSSNIQVINNITEKTRENDEDWKYYNYEFSEQITIDYEVISKETVDVTLGTFECLKLIIVDDSCVGYEEYFINDVGLWVKVIDYDDVDGNINIELVEYKMANEKKPVAFIDSISPNPAINTERIYFQGQGIGEGKIERYVWQSSIDGELYNGVNSDFSINDLSNGKHIISFKVQNFTGVWSDFVSKILIVTKKSIASINSISPNPSFEGETILFYGNGTSDGIIESYYWSSSIDDFLSDKKSFSVSDLSIGWHTIYFKVKDNNGVWSDEVNIILIIKKNQMPTVIVTSLLNGTKIFKSKSTVIINGTASDDVKIVKVQIKIDDAEWEDVNGTTNWSYEWDLTNVNEGNHTISIRAFDGVSYSEIEIINIVVEEKKKNEEGLNIIYIILIIGIIVLIGIVSMFWYQKKSTMQEKTPLFTAISQQYPPPPSYAKIPQQFPPPPPPPIQQNFPAQMCPFCREPLRYIEENQSWFCNFCQRYV